MLFVFFFKQKTAYEMRISDWSSDVCSSDLPESDLLESAMDDFERRHLLGDEQHFLAARDGGGDDVGDRLRLARPGRPLDDERSPAGGLGEDRKSTRLNSSH